MDEEDVSGFLSPKAKQCKEISIWLLSLEIISISQKYAILATKDLPNHRVIIELFLFSFKVVPSSETDLYVGASY